MGGSCSSCDAHKQSKVIEVNTDFTRKPRPIEDDSEDSLNETEKENSLVIETPDLVMEEPSESPVHTVKEEGDEDNVDIEDETLVVAVDADALDSDTDDEHWGVGTPMGTTPKADIESDYKEFPAFESNQLDFADSSNPMAIGELVAFGGGLATLSAAETSGFEDDGLQPPLDKSTLRMEVVVLNICGEDVALSRMRSRSRSFGRMRSASRSRRSVTVKPPKRKVKIKANYLRGPKSTLRKSAKYESREFDKNIVDIRETVEFELETRSDGRVAGHIEVLAKQSTGKLKKDKAIGYASIPLAHYLKWGLIARNGDSTDMTVDFFAKSKAQLTKEAKEDMEDFGIEDEPVSDQPVVARMDVKFRLFWDKKIWNAFHLRIAAKQKLDCLTTNPLDLMKLSAAKLKLGIVGAVMSEDSVAEWMQMDLAEMYKTMQRMESKATGAVADPSLAHSHAMIRVERRVHGAVEDVRRGDEHMSKTDECCFLGEEFVFDVAPFCQRTAVLRTVDSMRSIAFTIHPEIEYYDFDGGEENPGYLLLTVEKRRHKAKSRVEHGCALLKISSLLEKATLAPGSKNSDEVIFAEAMFQPLTRSTRKKQRKQPLLKTGFVLCKCCFEWQ